MKNWSNKDKITLGITFIIAGIFWFPLGRCTKKFPEPIIDNSQIVGKNKSIDSLLLLFILKDGIIAEDKNKQKRSDSVIISNHKNLKNDFEKIEMFTPDARAHYIDSVLRRANIRK